MVCTFKFVHVSSSNSVVIPQDRLSRHNTAANTPDPPHDSQAEHRQSRRRTHPPSTTPQKNCILHDRRGAPDHTLVVLDLSTPAARWHRAPSANQSEPLQSPRATAPHPPWQRHQPRRAPISPPTGHRYHRTRRNDPALVPTTTRRALDSPSGRTKEPRPQRTAARNPIRQNQDTGPRGVHPGTCLSPQKSPMHPRETRRQAASQRQHRNPRKPLPVGSYVVIVLVI